MPRSLVLRLVVPLLLASSAPARSTGVSLVLRIGDAVPGAGKITAIEAVEVLSNGRCNFLVRSDDPVAHTVVYAWGAPYVRTGDPLGSAAASFTSLHSPTWDLFGIPTFVAWPSGGAASQAVLYDGFVQFLTGAD